MANEIVIDLKQVHEKLDFIIENLGKVKKERVRLFAKDVAKLYDCSASTIKLWANDGKIPGYQTAGGKWFFYEDELKQADENRFK